MYLSTPNLLSGLTINCVSPQMKYIPLSGGLPLIGVCKNEIIATNRPRHPWIPAYAEMTEWAR